MEEFFFPAPCGSSLSTKDQTCPPCCGKALTTVPTRKSSSGGIDLRNRNNLSIVIEKAEYRGTAAAAAAKLLQSCPTLCDPIDSSPPGIPVPGILQARTLEWVAISFSNA